jgi:hypothetical protein
MMKRLMGTVRPQIGDTEGKRPRRPGSCDLGTSSSMEDDKSAAGRIPALQHGTKGSQRTRNTRSSSSRNGQWRRAPRLGFKLVEPHPQPAARSATRRRVRTAQTKNGAERHRPPGTRREWWIRHRRPRAEELAARRIPAHRRRELGDVSRRSSGREGD